MPWLYYDFITAQASSTQTVRARCCIVGSGSTLHASAAAAADAKVRRRGLLALDGRGGDGDGLLLRRLLGDDARTCCRGRRGQSGGHCPCVSEITLDELRDVALADRRSLAERGICRVFFLSGPRRAQLRIY